MNALFKTLLGSQQTLIVAGIAIAITLVVHRAAPGLTGATLPILLFAGVGYLARK